MKSTSAEDEKYAAILSDFWTKLDGCATLYWNVSIFKSTIVKQYSPTITTDKDDRKHQPYNVLTRYFNDITLQKYKISSNFAEVLRKSAVASMASNKLFPARKYHK